MGLSLCVPIDPSRGHLSAVLSPHRFDKRGGLLNGPAGLVRIDVLARVVGKQSHALNLVERLTEVGWKVPRFDQVLTERRDQAAMGSRLGQIDRSRAI